MAAITWLHTSRTTWASGKKSKCTIFASCAALIMRNKSLWSYLEVFLHEARFGSWLVHLNLVANQISRFFDKFILCKSTFNFLAAVHRPPKFNVKKKYEDLYINQATGLSQNLHIFLEELIIVWEFLPNLYQNHLTNNFDLIALNIELYNPKRL